MQSTCCLAGSYTNRTSESEFSYLSSLLCPRGAVIYPTACSSSVLIPAAPLKMPSSGCSMPVILPDSQVVLSPFLIRFLSRPHHSGPFPSQNILPSWFLSLFSVVVWDAGAQMERGVPEACCSEGLASERVKGKGARLDSSGLQKERKEVGRRQNRTGRTSDCGVDRIESMATLPGALQQRFSLEETWVRQSWPGRATCSVLSD